MSRERALSVAPRETSGPAPSGRGGHQTHCPDPNVPADRPVCTDSTTGAADDDGAGDEPAARKQRARCGSRLATRAHPDSGARANDGHANAARAADGTDCCFAAERCRSDRPASSHSDERPSDRHEADGPDPRSIHRGAYRYARRARSCRFNHLVTRGCIAPSGHPRDAFPHNFRDCNNTEISAECAGAPVVASCSSRDGGSYVTPRDEWDCRDGRRGSHPQRRAARKRRTAR